MINSVSSTELLNQGSLVDSYGKMLSVYEESGILNTETLNKIGKYLKVDVIIQGFVMDVYQRNGVFNICKYSRRKQKSLLNIPCFQLPLEMYYGK